MALSTVAKHLERAYLKLGVHSRTASVAQLAKLELARTGVGQLPSGRGRAAHHRHLLPGRRRLSRKASWRPAGAGFAARPQLAPGVTYERQVQLTRRGPLVLHTITAPKPTGNFGSSRCYPTTPSPVASAPASSLDGSATRSSPSAATSSRRRPPARDRDPERRPPARPRRSGAPASGSTPPGTSMSRASS